MNGTKHRQRSLGPVCSRNLSHWIPFALVHRPFDLYARSYARHVHFGEDASLLKLSRSAIRASALKVFASLFEHLGCDGQAIAI